MVIGGREEGAGGLLQGTCGEWGSNPTHRPSPVQGRTKDVSRTELEKCRKYWDDRMVVVERTKLPTQKWAEGHKNTSYQVCTCNPLEFSNKRDLAQIYLV